MRSEAHLCESVGTNPEASTGTGASSQWSGSRRALNPGCWETFRQQALALGHRAASHVDALFADSHFASAIRQARARNAGPSGSTLR